MKKKKKKKIVKNSKSIRHLSTVESIIEKFKSIVGMVKFTPKKINLPENLWIQENLGKYMKNNQFCCLLGRNKKNNRKKDFISLSAVFTKEEIINMFNVENIPERIENIRKQNNVRNVLCQKRGSYEMKLVKIDYLKDNETFLRSLFLFHYVNKNVETNYRSFYELSQNNSNLVVTSCEDGFKLTIPDQNMGGVSCIDLTSIYMENVLSFQNSNYQTIIEKYFRDNIRSLMPIVKVSRNSKKSVTISHWNFPGEKYLSYNNHSLEELEFHNGKTIKYYERKVKFQHPKETRRLLGSFVAEIIRKKENCEIECEIKKMNFFPKEYCNNNDFSGASNFSVLSNLHLTSLNYKENLEKLEKLKINETHRLCIAGNVINHGMSGEFKLFRMLLLEAKIKMRHVSIVPGSHDVSPYGQLGVDKTNFFHELFAKPPPPQTKNQISFKDTAIFFVDSCVEEKRGGKVVLPSFGRGKDSIEDILDECQKTGKTKVRVIINHLPVIPENYVDTDQKIYIYFSASPDDNKNHRDLNLEVNFKTFQCSLENIRNFNVK